ncbi:MAG: hypothetical protein ACLFSJ_06320 [Halorhodospira sp.]
MHEAITEAIYALALPFWVVIWWWVDGIRLQMQERMLWIPFILALLFLGLNLLMVILFGEVGDPTYEEARFSYIQDRALIVVQATASVLIVAVLVYGLTTRKVPVEFIRFMLFAFIFLIGVMSPILWVPVEHAGMFFSLRHFQTVALTYSLFLCVGGMTVLLRDIMSMGGARVDLDSDSNSIV